MLIRQPSAPIINGTPARENLPGTTVPRQYAPLPHRPGGIPAPATNMPPGMKPAMPSTIFPQKGPK